MRTTLVCLIAALATGCMDGSPQDPTQEALDLNYMNFTRVERPQYRFTWQQSCFCGEETTRPIRITVTNAAITSAVYVADQAPVAAGVRNGLRTIEGVFDLIQDRLDQHADEVTVSYDAAYYPASVFIDISKQASDEETSLHLSDFTSGTAQ